MKIAIKYLLVVVVLVLVAGSVRWSYTQTSLYKVRTVATRICSTIQPGIEIAQLEKLAFEEAGSFVQITPEFGVAAKSFCRCGVRLEHHQVVSVEHPVWCLN
jgi:hypothetical protein